MQRYFKTGHYPGIYIYYPNKLIKYCYSLKSFNNKNFIDQDPKYTDRKVWAYNVIRGTTTGNQTVEGARKQFLDIINNDLLVMKVMKITEITEKEGYSIIKLIKKPYIPKWKNVKWS